MNNYPTLDVQREFDEVKTLVLALWSTPDMPAFITGLQSAFNQGLSDGRSQFDPFLMVPLAERLNADVPPPVKLTSDTMASLSHYREAAFDDESDCIFMFDGQVEVESALRSLMLVGHRAGDQETGFTKKIRHASRIAKAAAPGFQVAPRDELAPSDWIEAQEAFNGSLYTFLLEPSFRIRALPSHLRQRNAHEDRAIWVLVLEEVYVQGFLCAKFNNNQRLSQSIYNVFSSRREDPLQCNGAELWAALRQEDPLLAALMDSVSPEVEFATPNLVADVIKANKKHAYMRNEMSDQKRKADDISATKSNEEFTDKLLNKLLAEKDDPTYAEREQVKTATQRKTLLDRLVPLCVSFDDQ